MGELAVGDVVTVPFPFSDLPKSKRRPALVVARVELGDFVLCQITSRDYASRSAIAVRAADFASGGLPVTSFVQPGKLFTASGTVALAKLGALSAGRLHEIRAAIAPVFTDIEA